MTERAFRLMADPAYKGFVALNYGPKRAVTIRRQSQMWWKMTSRSFVKWLERTNARKR
jgi:hypothetical protein